MLGDSDLNIFLGVIKFNLYYFLFLGIFIEIMLVKIFCVKY